jgi:tryptophan 7-halogenase
VARPVESILIVGSGFAAWASAALLARATAGRVALRVAAAADGGDAGESLMGSCRPEIPAAHYALGIEEPVFMRATSATFNLGTEFRAWSEPRGSYVHGYGDIGARLGPVAFHQLLSRVRLAGVNIPNPDEFSLAAVAARAGRFAHPVADKKSVASTYSYGYHFDVAAAAAWMRSVAERQGVRQLSAPVREVGLRDDGFLQSVTLEGGETINAQLFLDCSGPQSRLLGQALGVPFESWQQWLPCDRVMQLRTARAGNCAPSSIATARSAGWRLDFPLQHHDVHALFYSGAGCTDEQAAEELAAQPSRREETTPVVSQWLNGRRREFWVRNCVAIGAAGAQIDPIGSTSIQLIYNSINRLIGLFPHEDCAAELIRQFNQRTIAEHERARDFAALHFGTSSRQDSPLWRERGSVRLPEPLEYRLKLFRQAGRLAAFDDEIFAEADWINAFLGQGIWPEQADPLTLSLEVESLVARATRLQQIIRQAADAMPIHQKYLEKLGLAERGPTPPASH